MFLVPLALFRAYYDPFALITAARCHPNSTLSAMDWAALRFDSMPASPGAFKQTHIKTWMVAQSCSNISDRTWDNPWQHPTSLSADCSVVLQLLQGRDNFFAENFYKDGAVHLKKAQKCIQAKMHFEIFFFFFLNLAIELNFSCTFVRRWCAIFKLFDGIRTRDVNFTAVPSMPLPAKKVLNTTDFKIVNFYKNFNCRRFLWVDSSKVTSSGHPIVRFFVFDNHPFSWTGIL